MTDPTFQYQLMARQFIELWQQQIANTLMDERFVAASIDAMNQTLQGTPYAAPTAQPAVSPDATGDALRRFEQRLAASEARIAELERELAGLYRSGANGNSRKPGAKKAKYPPA